MEPCSDNKRDKQQQKQPRLPPWDQFFPLFADIQYRSFQWHTNHNLKKKVLEDYLLIAPGGIDKNIPVLSFRNILEKHLQPAYRIAFNQGFGLWEV
jgi:ADP-heptose:LPS heptosyltransferase